MAFWGCEFLFDGISCRSFDLMIYNTDGGTQNDVSFSSFSKVHEERVPSRYSSYFYGIEQNQPLEFSITFGINPDLLDRGRYLSRDDIALITSWLHGSKGYQKLEIVQDDMYGYYYMARVSDLTLLTNGMMPYGFTCVFSCDSPFAYTETTEVVFGSSGETEFHLRNRSTYNGYYKPQIRISKNGTGDVSIINCTDDNYEFALSNVDDGNTIHIDNSRQIIINETTGKNMYPHFNFHFFRMKPGENIIRLCGNFEIIFYLCFPINIGA